MKLRTIYLISALVILAISISSCRSKALCPAYLTDNSQNTTATEITVN